MYWYQQQPGSPPRYFLYYYSDSDKELGPGVPSRVSGSKDASTNTAILPISRMQAEDEAITVLYIMAVGAATLTHSVSDNEEVRQKPVQQ